ncbi:MAG TPA: hypothetical protein VGW12_14635 [Pyrinomonadaceae bacterium]|nr:hypothetical protein [Pyrinomonadaceae bacterium]
MRTISGRALVAFFLALFIFPVAAARASEIDITSGYLHLEGPFHNGPFFSFGNPAQGFAISNAGYRGGDGGSWTAGCFPCRAGQTFSRVRGYFGGGSTLGHGPATVSGTNHERVYYQPAIWVFYAPAFVLPAATNSDKVTVTLPFSMRGHIGLSSSFFSYSPFFRTSLKGQGKVVIVFDSFFSEALGYRLYELDGVTFYFSSPRKDAGERKTQNGE